MSLAHTYGPTCRLSQTTIFSDSGTDNDVPNIRAQFFYSSPLPIDDPLSALPIPVGSNSSVKHPPRPFSARDSHALEEAWLSLASIKNQKKHNTVQNTLLSGGKAHNADPIYGDQAAHNQNVGVSSAAQQKSIYLGTNLNTRTSDNSAMQYENFGHTPKVLARLDKDNLGPVEVIQGDGGDDPRSESHHESTYKRKRKRQDTTASGGISTSSNVSASEDESRMGTYPSQFGSLPNHGNSGTSGMPFLKYSSPRANPRPSSPTNRPIDHGAGNSCLSLPKDGRPSNIDLGVTETTDHRCDAYKTTKQDVDVPVGVSRLHLVKIPTLQMHPIYWSPVHDIATVTRATWFYRETMYPIEPGLANQLEFGYRELRPWSQTWKDELNSAIEVGAAGEEKIAYHLWSESDNKISTTLNHSSSIIAEDPHCAAKCFHGEAAAEGTIDSNTLQGTSPPKRNPKNYAQSQVIYKDAQYAFILKPSLQPSAYHGRRPLHKIKKGMTVGIPVVRGFNWKAWEKCHPSTISKVAVKVFDTTPVAVDTDASKQSLCAACRLIEDRPKVTDLILVIHGIGQKLSERVESFHFTHAINTFRRSVNVELCNEAVQRVMRDDLGGVMVLPVNWRSNLSFEDGGPLKDGDNSHGPSNFSLKDITPKTIPAVRNLISDVMLDIPFYMSHHKPKMIQALIEEANRVYKLWCGNNPSFHSDGRVHIIAHSLGSVMALEVLSNQPTSVPRIDLRGKEINAKYFDFNTTNLFFCGSPAGFFLLLDKGTLTPRRGQNKYGSEKRDDDDPGITSQTGTFGCLAVDNIYNIMHYNDPIAYRLNATVDTQYAASLKNAQVPSATVGFFESIGNVMKSISPGTSTAQGLAVGQVAKPSSIVRLPSQLEMEVHDFTREEMAEKKFALLNDNGQVDWFLSSGGGPLEVRYLNMLGAHSSYWGSPDFIRMVVLECGRKPGKGNAFPNMKAIKEGHKP